MRQVLLFTVFVVSNLLVLGQGRSKEGKYVERYDIPFYVMTFDDGRVYRDGMVTIMVDIEDAPVVPTNLYLGFKDSNGESIEWEYFGDEIPPLVTYNNEDVVGLSTSGQSLKVSGCYTIYWGDQRYVFGLYKGYQGNCDYVIERLYGDGKKLVRRDTSFTCTIDKSHLLKFGRVFREAQRRGTIRIMKI